MSRDNILSLIAEEAAGERPSILILGCGGQADQLEQLISTRGVTLVFCDISKGANADLFCDAHKLPFINGIFDGVITTAVLEHVLYPDQVVAEIVRVLKLEGFIYSELPFLQSVHEGAYDFTRYSLSGHRRLMEDFGEIKAGQVAGPGTALVWAISDFAKALLPGRKKSSLAGLVARALFFWLKYFDYITIHNHHAIDYASCTYFYGRKCIMKTPATDIVAKYSIPVHPKLS